MLGSPGRRKVRVVEHVERLPTELHPMVFRPRHDEVLRHSDVQVGETRPMHRIPRSGFAAEWETERTQRGTLIREELDRARRWIGVNVPALPPAGRR